ncbi:hypothetical protein [Salinisphaera sp. Q1T1-3]|uniref:hypothetical protein n=1 Tax=Salinisphaera sp. Q1T1-3 TaxID=2321229 RepID=UPI001F32799F|nr:hypothetical protein [Salinisphaera sp. Q1T1-3]
MPTIDGRNFLAQRGAQIGTRVKIRSIADHTRQEAANDIRLQPRLMSAPGVSLQAPNPA